jgi:hypothetical protein
LLCMICSGYFVSLCCSVYCFCVNVYCTTATGWQPNCSYQILYIRSYLSVWSCCKMGTFLRWGSVLQHLTLLLWTGRELLEIKLTDGLNTMIVLWKWRLRYSLGQSILSTRVEPTSGRDRNGFTYLLNLISHKEVCWASVGKREADAGHACPAETLPGGDKHASWSALSPLVWNAGDPSCGHKPYC